MWEQSPEGSERATQRAEGSGLQPKTASAWALPCELAGGSCSQDSGGRTRVQKGDGER